ncbi:hypothetical protein HDU97_005305 [Phlyctochytrium planicorne]|nr:hypothetical protein HDU97_005305 [Phlyctochytrium planicorne]
MVADYDHGNGKGMTRVVNGGGNADEVDSATKKMEAAGPGAKTLPNQILEIIVPSYSAWFSFNSIHEIERRGLPEFFNNRNKTKSPDTYVEYRNFMVNTYRLNPGEYLTVTACRRNLTGDVCSIIRVHAFLEQWGLINYQPDVDTRPGAPEKPTFINPDFKRTFRVTTQAVKIPTPPFGPITREVLKPRVDHNTPVHHPAKPDLSRSLIPQKRSADDTSGMTAVLVPSRPTMQKRIKKNCNTCLSDCTNIFYHSVRNPSLNVCPVCYSDGRFPASMLSTDFVRITNFLEDRYVSSNMLDESVPWSDSEIYLLLEGVEMFNEDWGKIADHVGTRSKEQCFMCFLQLPIEELHIPGGLDGTVGDMVDLLVDVDADLKRNLSVAPVPLKLRKIPLTLNFDPTLSVAALLVAFVRPEVARISAKSAIQAVEEIRGRHWAEQTLAAAKEVKESAKAHSSKHKASMTPGPSSAGDRATSPSHAKQKSGEKADDDIWQSSHLNVEEEKEARRIRARYHHLEGQLFAQKLVQFLEVDALLENERAEVEIEKKQLLHDRVSLGRDRVMTTLIAQAAKKPGLDSTASAAATPPAV